MLDRIKRIFKDWVTEPDGITHCPIRWVAVIGIFQGLGTEVYTVFWQHAAFDLQAFGVGLGAIIATVGAALGMKKDTPKDVP